MAAAVDSFVVNPGLMAPRVLSAAPSGLLPFSFLPWGGRIYIQPTKQVPLFSRGWGSRYVEVRELRVLNPWIEGNGTG